MAGFSGRLRRLRQIAGLAHADTTVTLRGKKTKYEGYNADCVASAAGLVCPMEEDVGMFTLAQWAAGVKLVVTGHLSLMGPDQIREESTEDLRNSEDRTFLLPPAPAAACK
jgi:hypothetical protein